MKKTVQQITSFFGNAGITGLVGYVTVCLMGLDIVASVIRSAYEEIAYSLLFLLIFFLFLRAKKKSNKGAQHSLMGALVMWLNFTLLKKVMDEVILCEAEKNAGIFGLAFKAVTVITFIVVLLFTISFFKVTGDHRSSVLRVAVNQILVLTIACCLILLAATELFASGMSKENMLGIAINGGASIFFMLSVLCFEASCHAYKNIKD